MRNIEVALPRRIRRSFLPALLGAVLFWGLGYAAGAGSPADARTTSQGAPRISSQVAVRYEAPGARYPDILVVGPAGVMRAEDSVDLRVVHYTDARVLYRVVVP